MEVGCSLWSADRPDGVEPTGDGVGPIFYVGKALRTGLVVLRANGRDSVILGVVSR